MSENGAREEIQRRFASDAEVAQAVRKAVRNAVLDHERAGNPVAAWRDGKIVLVAPEEIALPEEEPSAQTGAVPDVRAARH